MNQIEQETQQYIMYFNKKERTKLAIAIQRRAKRELNDTLLA
jgi:hypothetical protein